MSIVKIRAALETALVALPNILAPANITFSSSGASGVFFTSAPHFLAIGVNVNITGHTGANPPVSGSYIVSSVPTIKSFTLDADYDKVHIALSSGGVGGVVTANLNAWENVTFQGVNPIPYQVVTMMLAKPDNPTFGGGHYRENGLFQINLNYPVGFGTRDVTERAELIRKTFKRGSSFTNGGVTVHIGRTPEILVGLPAISNVPLEESYIIPIRVSWWADVFE